MITRRRLGEILAAIAIGAVQPAVAQNLDPRAGGGALGVSTGPKQVLIIRHGEKLGSGDRDEEGGSDLSLRGSARAMALPSLFSPVTPQLACDLAASASSFTGTYSTVDISRSAPRFQMPTFVFATKASHHSNRPIETVSPLIAAFKLPLDADHSDDDYAKVAHDILSKPKYGGAIVLVCWHHGKIPDLARALGAKNPPPWPGTVFERVWQLDYSGGPPVLTNLPQQLLYGDSNT
jgi:hypothetical protein